eukprot:scpid26561/ scgid32867/ 
MHHRPRAFARSIQLSDRACCGNGTSGECTDDDAGDEYVRMQPASVPYPRSSSRRSAGAPPSDDEFELDEVYVRMAVSMPQCSANRTQVEATPTKGSVSSSCSRRMLSRSSSSDLSREVHSAEHAEYNAMQHRHAQRVSRAIGMRPGRAPNEDDYDDVESYEYNYVRAIRGMNLSRSKTRVGLIPEGVSSDSSQSTSVRSCSDWSLARRSVDRMDGAGPAPPPHLMDRWSQGNSARSSPGADMRLTGDEEENEEEYVPILCGLQGPQKTLVGSIPEDLSSEGLQRTPVRCFPELSGARRSVDRLVLDLTSQNCRTDRPQQVGSSRGSPMTDLEDEDYTRVPTASHHFRRRARADDEEVMRIRSSGVHVSQSKTRVGSIPEDMSSDGSQRTSVRSLSDVSGGGRRSMECTDSGSGSATHVSRVERAHEVSPNIGSPVTDFDDEEYTCVPRTVHRFRRRPRVDEEDNMRTRSGVHASQSKTRVGSIPEDTSPERLRNSSSRSLSEMSSERRSVEQVDCCSSPRNSSSDRSQQQGSPGRSGSTGHDTRLTGDEEDEEEYTCVPSSDSVIPHTRSKTRVNSIRESPEHGISPHASMQSYSSDLSGEQRSIERMDSGFSSQFSCVERSLQTSPGSDMQHLGDEDDEEYVHMAATAVHSARSKTRVSTGSETFSSRVPLRRPSLRSCSFDAIRRAYSWDQKVSSPRVSRRRGNHTEPSPVTPRLERNRSQPLSVLDVRTAQGAALMTRKMAEMASLSEMSLDGWTPNSDDCRLDTPTSDDGDLAQEFVKSAWPFAYHNGIFNRCTRSISAEGPPPSSTVFDCTPLDRKPFEDLTDLPPTSKSNSKSSSKLSKLSIRKRCFQGSFEWSPTNKNPLKETTSLPKLRSSFDALDWDTRPASPAGTSVPSFLRRMKQP